MSDINYIVNDFKVIPRITAVTKKINLVGQTRDQLKEKLTLVGVLDKQLNMRVKQIWHWIYFRGVRNFDEMTNLSKSLQQSLAENYSIDVPEIIEKQESSDGTRKYLVRIIGRHEVEVVYIPEEDRGTLCMRWDVTCRRSRKMVC